jgi:hypothetical protein
MDGRGRCGRVQPVAAASPAGLKDFVDLVVPELQRRGLHRSSYEGTTLRDRLGLDKVPSRHR